jgi:hypothetical protein
VRSPQPLADRDRQRLPREDVRDSQRTEALAIRELILTCLRSSALISLENGLCLLRN